MQADVVAVMEVAFVPYGNLVLLREVLHGTATGLPDLSEVLGPCLPGKAGMREKTTDADASHVLRAAIDNAAYSAVVFLRRRGSVLSLVCGEPAAGENWLSHPRHAPWRARLDAALHGRG